MLTRGGPEFLDTLRFLIVIQATTFTFPSSKYVDNKHKQL